MRGIHRRLAKLESVAASDASARGADHGLDPRTYARAMADLSALMACKPQGWSAEARDALAPLLLGSDPGQPGP